MRRRLILALLLGGSVVCAAVLLLSGGPSRDTTNDIAGSLGLFDDPPFTVGLSGPLWRDRTLTSEDGAREFAYVTSVEELAVVIKGKDGAGVADVELRVDGRRQRHVRPVCPAARCPTSVRLAFMPFLDTKAGGDRRVQVVVRDPRALGRGTDVGSHVATAGLMVHVGPSLPLARESEPVTASRSPFSSNTTRVGALLRKARPVLQADRRSGSLHLLLGRSGMRVREIGELTAGRRPLGATLLLELTPARLNIKATVPAYVPASPRSSYRLQHVRMRAAVLRDVLVDIDLARRKVIALEPGPRSQTNAWAPSTAAAPAGGADED